MQFRILLYLILFAAPALATTVDCLTAVGKAGAAAPNEQSLENRQASFSVTGRNLDAIAEDSGLPHDWINLKKIKAAGARVLDFGCGWGGLVLQMRAFGIEAYGTDFQMRDAQINNPKYPGWFTRQDVSEKTNYPENHFHIIYSTFSLFSYPQVTHAERVRALREMARVLMDDGRVHIAPYSNKEQMKEYLKEVPELEFVGLDDDVDGNPTAIELRRKPR